MVIEHTELRYGSKTLSVDVDEDNKTASMRIGTREPRWLHPRRQNETTIIVKKADEIFQNTAQRIGQSIQLIFDTANPKLINWARTRQDELKFDSVVPDDPNAYRVTISKRYVP